MSQSSASPLILGAVSRLGYEHLRPFILSLEQAGFIGQVFFVGYDISAETVAALRQHGVNLVLLPGDSPLKWVRICSARYFIYQDFLNAHGDQFSHVLLTDTRDVFFQRNPFEFDAGDGLLCFLEDSRKTLGNCKANSKWLTWAYGDKVVQELGAKPVSCSGTTMGSTAAIKEYLGKMVAEIARVSTERPIHSRMGLLRIDHVLSGIDQGIHNYILNTDPPRNLRLIENEHGPVMSLHHKLPSSIQFNGQGQVINADGNVVHVLHQYDRHKALAAHLLRKIGIKA